MDLTISNRAIGELHRPENECFFDEFSQVKLTIRFRFHLPAIHDFVGELPRPKFTIGLRRHFPRE
jgi:hypothetical protein